VNPDSDRWLSSEEARTKFRDLMDEVAHDDARVYILRYGKPAAVIVPVKWYEKAKELMSALDTCTASVKFKGKVNP